MSQQSLPSGSADPFPCSPPFAAPQRCDPLASFVSTPPRSLLCTLFNITRNVSRGTHPLPPPNNPSLHHSQMVPALSLKLTARPGFCSLPVALKFPLTGADYASS